jgi:predicted ATPase
MLGFPDQAVALTLENHQHASRRGHPFDHAFALTLGAEVFDFIREPDQLLRHAAEGARIGREHGIPLMADVLAEISKGIAWLRSGRAGDAIGQLRTAIDRLTRTGQRIWAPYLNALLAEALGAGGDAPGGLAVVADALDDIAARNERPHFAEELRIRALLETQSGAVAAAEATLRDAVEFAHAQQAKSWELRAATSLARLLADQGDTRSARDALDPVYDWFTEGFATHDLRQARTLLRELGVRRSEGPDGGTHLKSPWEMT